MGDHRIHDDQMPPGWHTVKSVLLVEIYTAANFHLCREAAEALFHARLIGEGIAREHVHLHPEGRGSALSGRMAAQEESKGGADG